MEPKTHRAVYLGNNSFFIESPSSISIFPDLNTPLPVTTLNIAPGIRLKPGEIYDITVENEIVVDVEVSEADVHGYITARRLSTEPLQVYVIDGIIYSFALGNVAEGYGVISGWPGLIKITIDAGSITVKPIRSADYAIGSKVKLFIRTNESSMSVLYLIEESPAPTISLTAEANYVEKARLDKTAMVNFDITNNGDLADNVRVSVEGVKATFQPDIYAVDAGETVTVPVYVDITTDVLAKARKGEYVYFFATSEIYPDLVCSASILTEDLIAYDFRVQLETSSKSADCLSVDVMLYGGGINYTQINTAIIYDAGLLEYAGYADLGGIAAEVKVAANEVAVRSVPSLNMSVGAPCLQPVKVVTLKFLVKDGMDAESAVSSLSFASLNVFPAGNFIGTATVLGKTISPIN